MWVGSTQLPCLLPERLLHLVMGIAAWRQAVLFQWVNGKAWVMATGAVAAFTTVAGSLWLEVLEITAAFLAVAFPCVGVWLVAGAGLRQLLTNHTAQRIFNVSMAPLLVFSVLPVVYDIWTFYTN